MTTHRPVFATLVSRLDTAPPGAVVTVEAPTGWGKSELLAEWREGASIPVLILDAPVGHASPLVERLAEAMHDAGFPPPTVSTDDRLDSLLAALGSTPVGLCIDGVEWFRDPESVVLLRRLVHARAPATTLVLAGRRLPSLRLGRVALTGQLLSLGAGDLALGPDCVALLVAGGPAADRTRQVLELTGGWLAGVRACLDACAAGWDERLARDAVTTRLREAIAPLAPEELALLRDIVLLGDTDVATLGDITGCPDISARFTALRDASVPLLDYSGMAFDRVHAGAPLAHLFPDQDQRRDTLLRAAAARADRLHYFQRAFDLLQRTGDRQALSQFVYHRGGHLALAGQPETVTQWLEAFGADEVGADRGLSLTLAIAAAADGDFGAMERLLLRLELNPDAPDPPWANERPRVAVLEQAPAPEVGDGTDVPAPWIVLGQMMRGSNCFARGDFAESERILVGITPFCRPYATLDIWRCATLATVYAVTDRAALGAAVVEQGERLAVDAGLVDHAWTVCLDPVIAQYATFAGDTERARRALRSGQAKLARIRSGFGGLRLVALLQLASVALWLGDARTADELLAAAAGLLTQADSLSLLVEEHARLRRRTDALEASGLTAAELTVLRHLATHIAVPDIAAALFVSAATIRSHVRSLSRKLNVKGRTAAVQAATTRGVLG